jgi:hypothetical protein
MSDAPKVTATKWLETILLDEMGNIIAELDKKAGRTRDPSSLEACKQFARLMLGNLLRDERRAQEVRDRGETHARAFACDFFKKHVTIHFPN